MNGDRVRQVRELLGLTQEELSDMIGLTQGAVAHLESGRMDASAQVANAIALRTGFSLDFYHSQEPELPAGSILYRCKRSVKSTERSRAHRYAQVAYEVAHYLMKRLKEIPVTIPCGIAARPVEAAAIARSAIGLSPDAPIPNLISSLERAGVIVLTLPFEVEGLDGFSTWVQTPEHRRPLIVLGKQVAGYRTRFTVGEEYGHLTMHSPLLVSTKEADKQARLFAGELLVPREAILREVESPVTLAGLARLKHRWKIAISALLHRTLDVGLVDGNQYRYLNYQISARGWKKGEPGDERIAPESPRLLSKMAEVVYGDKRIKSLRDEVGIPQYILRAMLDGEPFRNPANVISMRR